MDLDSIKLIIFIAFSRIFLGEKNFKLSVHGGEEYN